MSLTSPGLAVYRREHSSVVVIIAVTGDVGVKRGDLLELGKGAATCLRLDEGAPQHALDSRAD
jgi:hypothetical protein